MPHSDFTSNDLAPAPAPHQPDHEMGTAIASASADSTGALLLRTAECLTALLQAPTARAGLNESRYNVLNVLRHKDSGTCTQTELATLLLQSESNLSTLLERMRLDGLISRVRSESDRRISLIGLSAAGREALLRAVQARARAVAPIFKALDEQRAGELRESLGQLVRQLEHTLGVAGRGAGRRDATGSLHRLDAGHSGTAEQRAGRSVRSQNAIQHSDETTPCLE